MVGRIAKGIVAGVAGTLAMDVFWWRRARREGRRHRFIDFEFTTGDTYETFDDAPAPARVAAKMAGIVGVELPKAAGGLANDIVHWGTGLSWGAFAGLLVGDDLMHPLTAGVLAGATAYTVSYAVLGSAGIYKPIWEYDLSTLGVDAAAHLTFGAGTGGALWLLRKLAP